MTKKYNKLIRDVKEQFGELSDAPMTTDLEEALKYPFLVFVTKSKEEWDEYVRRSAKQGRTQHWLIETDNDSTIIHNPELM